jgi:AcrR family transcriptional regulator
MLHELAFTSRRPLSARALWAGKRSGLLDIASQQSVASPSELARVLGARRFDGVERLCLALVAAGGLRCVDSNDGAAVELTELGRSVLRWQRDHLLAPPDNAPDWKALPGLVLGHTSPTDADDAQRWIERMMGENNSSFVEQFEREMAEVTEAETDAALAALACALQGGVSRLRSAVDVGGGNGYFAQQARFQLQLPRDASVHVVELPQVVQKCSALDGIEFLSGDFFDRNKIPQSDLYMMKVLITLNLPSTTCVFSEC